jgi:signal transduction histidine kinase
MDVRGVQPTPRQRGVDAALIVIALLFTLVTVLGADAYPAIADWYWPIDIALAVLSAASIWWGRRHPLLVGVLLVVPGTLAITASIAVLVGVYRLGSLVRPRLSAALVGMHILLALPYHWVAPVAETTWLSWLIFIPTVYLLSWSLGLLSRARRQVIEGLRQAALADRQRYESELATLRRDERERIAREMHDVLAHRISLLSVHAGALEFRTAPTPTAVSRRVSLAEVHGAALVIRENAHLAVEDLRELLLVLREDDGDVEELGAIRRQARLDDVHGLVAEARIAGQRVAITVDDAASSGTRAAVQRTAYRIVQEGLTNARKHAPRSPVAVSIRTDGDRLLVDVRNPVAIGLTSSEIPGVGSGIAGLTERVRIDGGRLRHGLNDGVFTLSGDLPIGDT